ncbi:hypothetical protein OROHE_018648 [Orobanche hederae]
MSSIMRSGVRLLRRQFSCAAAASELLRPAAPCLMLRACISGGDMMYNVYSPTKGKVVSFNNRGGEEEVRLMRDPKTVWVGSSHGWLAISNSCTNDMCLLNPFSGRHIKLPSPPSGLLYWPSKVILSCSPNDEGCRAVMILGANIIVATCRPDHSAEWPPLNASPEWAPLDASLPRFLGLMLALKGEELEGWDVDADGRPRVDRQVSRFGRHEFDPNGKRLTVRTARYLVCEEESDQLFLVRRYVVGETADYDVYRIGGGGDGGLELCSLLDDLAMFVGINHSFAVKASRFPGLKPNSIYFSDMRNSWAVNDRGQVYHTMDVFDYQNKRCSSLSSRKEFFML